jgi:hypothetical protein
LRHLAARINPCPFKTAMNWEFFSKLEVLPEERAACEIESGGLGFG